MVLGKTISEKIFEAHCGRECRAGDLIVAKVDFLMAHDANRPLAMEAFRRLGGTHVHDPAKMAYVLDHYTPAPSEAAAEIDKSIRDFCRKQGILLYENEGICHQILPEKGHVAPGDLAIGSDSHTCTYGALNAFATGVGSTDLAAAMLTGGLWFKVPGSIRFRLHGALPKGVYSKDLMLYLIHLVTAEGASYQAVEFGGEVIHDLSIDARLTMSNMAIEMGAKAGIMEPDERLLSWIRSRSSRPFSPVRADANAVYVEIHEIDVSHMSPQIAQPHRVDQVVPIENIGDVRIQQANLASCTNGRVEDLAIAAGILRGKKIHPDVRLLVVPASRRIFLEALEKGIIQSLMEAGAVVRHSSCAGCSGGAAFGTPANGDVVISTANRNFKGRLGNTEAFIYLASPATVAASAIEGRIADCRKYL